MPAILTILAILVLLLSAPASAQDPDPSSAKMPAARGYDGPSRGFASAKVIQNRIGVVLKDEASEEAVARVLKDGNYTLDQRLPGGVRILKLPSSQSRAALIETANNLVAPESSPFRQAGILAIPAGSTQPVIILQEIIVGFRPDTDESEIRRVASENNLDVADYSVLNEKLRALQRKEIELPGKQAVFRAKQGSAIDALALSQTINRTQDVEFAEPNVVLPLELRQMPTLSPDQWHHRNTGQDNGTVGADARTFEAWRLAQGSQDTVIAVIELGFDASHPSLANQTASWDFVRNGPPSGKNDSAEVRHGTAMAGLAAGAANATGILGACPGCRLMLLRVSPDTATIERALRYARDNGADVITNSWGLPQGAAMPESLRLAIEIAARDSPTDQTKKGAVILFAMDNAYVEDCDDHPTGLESVIAVSRSTNRDLADRAGYGRCLSLLAPSAWQDTVPSRGTRWIASTDTTGPEGYNDQASYPGICPELPQGAPIDLDFSRCVSGTSASTALVAGVAGLALSATDPSTLTLTRVDVKRLLQDTADKIEPWAAEYGPEDGRSKAGDQKAATHGFGRVNAFEALSIVAPVVNAAGIPGHGGVDVFLRDSPLDWGNTTSTTAAGAPPNPRGNVQSVDIKLDAPPFDEAPTPESFDAFEDDTAPSPDQASRVYVRVHNRGPTAAPATVTLYAAMVGRTLPRVPAGWSVPQGSEDVEESWRSFSCSSAAPACSVPAVGYSGASVGGTSDDGSIVVQFALPRIQDWSSQRRLSLLATVAAAGAQYSDTLPATTGSMTVEELAPASNNVTYRNYPEDSVEDGGTCATRPDKSFLVSNPPPGVRAAVTDTISSYAWTLDDKRADDFADLFDASGTYEVCAGGGDSRVYEATSNEIRTLIREQFGKLAKVQTRHILSNTQFRTNTDLLGNVLSVDTRTTMLVTMQHNDADRAVPNLDYTAEVRATLVPVSGQWRFRSLAIYTDSPQLVLRGR